MTLRPLTLLAMLVALGLLISRTSDPATWRFLEKGSNTSEVESPPPVIRDSKETAAPVAQGPTDDDPEEAAAAVEEALAISDKALELGPEEMPLYWRMFRWVQHQPFSGLQQRAMKDVVLNQFMRSPDETRGSIVQLKLNVRRVIRYEAPQNSAGVKDVYEIWGWTDESQAWPYVVVVPQIPAGMPIGHSVYERATFVGYFYKLQGYLAAGAGPQDKPLTAPLLIGRISWQPSPARVEKKTDLTWLWWLGIGAVIFGAIRLGMWRYNSVKSKADRKKRTAADRVQAWLQVQSDDSSDSPIRPNCDSSNSRNNAFFSEGNS